jgi:hypothetical protein
VGEVADLEIDDGRRRVGKGFLPALGSGSWEFILSAHTASFLLKEIQSQKVQ